MNTQLSQLVKYISVLILFVAISVGYFIPDIFQNKSLLQVDTVAGMAAGRELQEHAKEHGEKTYWTNALFSGMPSYQIAPSYPSTTVISQLQKLSGGFLPGPASLIFMMLCGSFLLFIALGMDLKVAVLGAIAYTFSSYFIILIEAGHIWKYLVLSYIPPTFAGIIWAYRGRYLLGGTVAALYIALQLYSNHPQMTFYFGLMLIFYIVAEGFSAYKTQHIARFVKASAVLLGAGALGLALNATTLYHSYQYAAYTMRGPSELTNNKEQQTKSGIDKDYATQWSYGIEETLTLLIPDTKGGSTKSLQEDKKALKVASNEMRTTIAEQNRYWGNQPFTSGPVYVGAFIMFLFILGIGIVHGPLKWSMVGATILSILLAWGHNFMWLTDLFLDYFPLYNKFRTVSSILVIAELCIPILAMLALWQIIQQPTVLKERKKAFYIALGTTAGLSLLLLIFPGMLSFLSNIEMKMIDEGMKNAAQASSYAHFSEDLQAVRKVIFKSDAFHSIFIITLGLTCVLVYTQYINKGTANKTKWTRILLGSLCLLTLFDMVGVGKRYLNSKDFHPKEEKTIAFPLRPADQEILQDKNLSYRVFDLSSGNPFSDGHASYYHQSIAGYHAAKLRRYQDLIENHISKMNFSVLNMLNTKYIITANNNIQEVKLNTEALGNAWFVDRVNWVNNADEELAALNNFNPKTTAFADKKFESILPPAYVKTVHDSTAQINLTSYLPNKLTYTSNSTQDKLAVFSEVYYPHGWYAFVDDVEVPIIRVNYILRAIALPAGTHKVELRFDPKSLHRTETLARIAAGIFILLLLTGIGLTVYRFKKKRDALK